MTHTTTLNLLQNVKVQTDCLTGYCHDLVTIEQLDNWALQVAKYKQSEEWLSDPKGVDDNYHEGRRFNDNERIVDVILGCMRLQINKYLGEHNLGDSESSFKIYINSIGESKFNEWINAALHYSAGCDHWYTFEKEW